MNAQSGLGQAETEVQARARMRRATAGQWYWRLSRAGRNSGSGSDGGDRGWKAQGTAAAVTVGGGRDAGTQGFAGRENLKWQVGQTPPPPPPPPPQGLNRLACGNRRVSHSSFRYF